MPAAARLAPPLAAAAPVITLPQLTVSTIAEHAAGGFEIPCPTAAQPKPTQPNSKVVVLKPMPTVSLTAAAPLGVPPEEERPALAIPTPGLIALDFYCQRGNGSAVPLFQWHGPAIAPQLPRLGLKPAFEKLEDLVLRKRTTPAIAEVFSITDARKGSGNATVRHAVKAIAAGLMVATALWFGAAGSRVGTQMTAVSRVAEVPADVPTVAADAGLSRPESSKSGATGPLAWVRQTIANRAAVQLTDSFSGGMQAWGSAPKTWAPGWSRHPDGYVHTGPLALFQPSMTFADYRLEFFGQIENKSIGWAVRAHDPKNYYAMKFRVVEPGLRPIIAISHYPVVGGKAGRSVEVPLNVMVHNNTPFQVAVLVKGHRFVTSVDGQEVDSWTDDTLASGGVGFFSEAGEHARLYWMKVSRNTDLLGRVCAYLSGGSEGQATADLWWPDIPGGTPRPSAPAGPQSVALAALPAAFWRKRRSPPWSS